jgi:hypothetical protein
MWAESCRGAKKSPEGALGYNSAPTACGHVAAVAYFAYFAYDNFAIDTSRSWSAWLGRWRLLPAAAGSCE